MIREDQLRRTAQIERIEKGVKEIADIIHSVGILIDEQGGILDNIENNILNAKADVVKGNKDVDEASKYQESSLACLLIGALVVIVLIICIVFIAKANS